MIDIRKYFTLMFDVSHPISRLNLQRFTEKHLAALVQNNTGGKYDAMIAATSAAFTDFFGNIEDKDLAVSIQKSKTRVNDLALQQFIDAVDKYYNLIAYKFPKDTPQYLEFFPKGKTEYTEVLKPGALMLMDRMISACTAHVVEITQVVVNEFTAIRTSFSNSRTEQLQKMEVSDSESSEIAATRAALEFQLNKNILTLALEYLGDVDRGMDFFDQQYLGRTGATGAGTTPTPSPTPTPVPTGIKAVSKQVAPFVPITIEVAGTAGKQGTINWGDGTVENYTMQGNFVNLTHTYTTAGDKIIIISENTDSISEFQSMTCKLISLEFTDDMRPIALRLSNNQLTAPVLPDAILVNLRYVFLDSNNLTVQFVNDFLIRMNTFNTATGSRQLFLNDGTNAAPTGQGVAAKNQLINKGWQVSTN